MKRTPLYDAHIKAGGRIIEFGGWDMPVQFTGIIDEHSAVRNSAGMFDVSHMGELIIEGADAEESVQRLVTNDVSKAAAGRIIYSPMCYPDGGTVDDLLVYKMGENVYLLVVNAANTEKDCEWITEKCRGRQVNVRNVSEEYAQIAVQGPKSEELVQKLVNTDIKGLKFYHFLPETEVCGIAAILSRTGYTGEDGFEIYISPDKALQVWNSILEAGSDIGIKPIGLGARDTLRLEAALPLYGHELSEKITPVEARLNRFINMDKGEFIGRKVLAEQMENGVMRGLAGIEMLDRGIPREGYDIYHNGKPAGFVTSGSYSPTLGKNIGMAMLDTHCTAPGTIVEVMIRNTACKAQIVGLPFYNKKYKKN